MEGASELYCAVVLCDEDEVVAVLGTAAGAACAGDADPASGYTALHHAAAHRLNVAAAALVNHAPATVHAASRDLILGNTVVQPGGQTPLHLAAENGDAVIVALLLHARADPTKADINGTRPAMAAAMKGRAEVAATLQRAALAYAGVDSDAIAPPTAVGGNGAGNTRSFDVDGLLADGLLIDGGDAGLDASQKQCVEAGRRRALERLQVPEKLRKSLAD